MKIRQILLFIYIVALIVSCGQVAKEIEYEEPSVEADIQPNGPVIINDQSRIELPLYKRKESIEKTTFLSCDVERNTASLEKYMEGYKEVLLRKILKSRSYNHKASLETYTHTDTKLIYYNAHPFAEAVCSAYSSHYPLTISPDMIWLLIAQGFANHVNENAEKLRYDFVDFEGKKELLLHRDEFIKGSNDNDWMAVFEEFGQQIEANTSKDLLDLVTGEFSTTGPIEKAAFQVCLMDAMKPYFEFHGNTRCGIPEITLEGTVEDWKMIEKRAAALAKYDLDWWIDELMPVLKEFTKAAEGDVNQDFWASIFKMKQRGCHGILITGWMLKFFPYTQRAEELVQFIGNDKNLRTWEENKEKVMIAHIEMLPSGLSKVPFTWHYYDVDYKMEFNAGFVGYTQDAKTLSLRPEIGWAVIDLGQKSWAKGK